MKKSPILFLLCLVMGWLFAAMPLLPQAVRAQQETTEIRGVWMTSNDMGTLRNREKLQIAVDQLSQANFNTIYPVVWNGGYAYYPSKVTERRKFQSFTYRGFDGQDILDDLIQQAHARNLLVIPWFEFGFMTPLGSDLARQHPGWLTQQRDGSLTSISAAGEVAWLNPFHPDVQAFITELVMEVVTEYDIDGIQFDDHMSLPSQFGYDPYTISLYVKETKKQPPANAQDGAWLKWRADKITDYMVSLKKEVSSKKPDAIFSVSPNYYDFAYKLQLQDWLAWVRKNVADEIIVQVYRPDLQSFLPQLSRAEILETQKKIPTAIAIMTGQRTKPVPMQLIESQAMAAKDRNLGVAFFYYETLWNHATELHQDRKESFQKLFPTAALRKS